uniref:Multifunctional methyltransferase subunit TRM112-like protein n=1 Tax=Junco hyemalis TaxID=40217 RepID=A0A8C5IIL6_JUNHY
MKLLTHNLLSSHVPGLRPGAGFPLRIEAAEVRVRPVPFNAAFVSRMVPRLRWDALREAAESVRGGGEPGTGTGNGEPGGGTGKWERETGKKERGIGMGNGNR